MLDQTDIKKTYHLKRWFERRLKISTSSNPFSTHSTGNFHAFDVFEHPTKIVNMMMRFESLAFSFSFDTKRDFRHKHFVSIKCLFARRRSFWARVVNNYLTLVRGRSWDGSCLPLQSSGFTLTQQKLRGHYSELQSIWSEDLDQNPNVWGSE